MRRYQIRLFLKILIPSNHSNQHRLLNRPKWRWVKCERYLLSPGGLRLLAQRICPLPEGHAVVTVDLLARVSLLFDAYGRLLREHDAESYIQALIDSIRRMQSELRQYLMPEEQQRTDHT